MIERLVYRLVCDPWKSLLVIFRLLQFICWVANRSTVCLLFLSCFILCIELYVCYHARWEENEECWLIRGRLHLTCHLIFDIHFLLFAHLRRLQQWMVDLFCRLFSWHQKHFMYFNTIWSTVMHSLMPVASFIAFFPLYYDQIFTFPSLPFNQCVLCALCTFCFMYLIILYMLFSVSLLFSRTLCFVVFFLVLDTFRNWFWHLDDIYIGTKMYVVHLAGYASHLFCTDA